MSLNRRQRPDVGNDAAGKAFRTHLAVKSKSKFFTTAPYTILRQYAQISMLKLNLVCKLRANKSFLHCLSICLVKSNVRN